MTNSNETELVRRLLLNDVTAFDTLYHRHHNPLYFNILKLTKDGESARDLLQEVFITLWKRRSTLDPDQSISAWLFAVSYNKSVDYLKRTLAESTVVHPARVVHSAGDIRQSSPDEQEADLKEAQLQLLEEAIQQLSPQKRKVFELCKLQGKSYEETAKELHISKHTVKEYLSGSITYIKSYIRQHPDYYTGCVSVPFLGLFILMQ